MGNTNDVGRGSAVWAVARIHSMPEAAVPILIECLSDSNSTVRVNAAMGLRDFGSDARRAVPALIKSLKDPDERTKSYAESALKAIDPEAYAKLGLQ